MREEQKDKEATIEVGSECKPQKILRMIISHYIAGYDTIVVKSMDSVLDTECRNYIKKYVRRLLFGAEFMDEAAEFIKIQVLTPYVTLPTKNIIKRMSDLAINMHKDIIKAIKYRNTMLLKDVIERDDDVDRLYFLSIRQLTSGLYSPKVSSQIGIDNLHECLEYRLVVRHLERIADHATIIANMIRRVIDEIEDEYIEILEKMSKVASSELKMAIEALLEKNQEQAESAIKMRKTLREMENKAIDMISDLYSGRLVAAMRMAIESYRRVAEYSAGIAETAINLTVSTAF